jgi:excisionase family DNA binding protein
MENQGSRLATEIDLLLLEGRLKAHIDAALKIKDTQRNVLFSPDQVARIVGQTAEADYRENLKRYFADLFREIVGTNINAKNKGGGNPDEEPLVSVAEAAKITGLAVNTLYDKTYQRAIPHYKKGKRVYFRVSELVAWIAAGRVATSAEIEAKAVTHVLNNPVSPRGKGGGGWGKK